MVWLALLSIAMSVGAQFLLKAGMSSGDMRAALAQSALWPIARAVVTQPSILAGFLLYAAGAVVWLAVLARWDVSKAYPLVGLGFVATALIGMAIGEGVTASRLLGVAIICGGVLLVARS